MAGASITGGRSRRTTFAAKWSGAASASRRPDADHPEGQHFAFGLAHRDIFADLEQMVAEAEALVFVGRSRLPFESPCRAAEPSGPMGEKPLHRRLVRPEAVCETLAAMDLPRFEVDAALFVEGRDEVVAVPDRPVRELFRPRRLQGDLAEGRIIKRSHRSTFFVPSSPRAGGDRRFHEFRAGALDGAIGADAIRQYLT